MTDAHDRPAVAGADDSDEHADEHGENRRSSSFLRDFLQTLVIALGLSMIIKLFIAQAFYIPSESMAPTLTQDDRLVVSKLTPGPFALERGDIVVFEDPADWLAPAPPANPVVEVLAFVGLAPDPSDDHLIKRIIGMEGDTVTCEARGAQVEVNGVTLEEPYVAPDAAPCQAEFTVTVPQDSLWVMGDNRDDSADSAYHWAAASSTGEDPSSAFVPMENVTGKAKWIMWPVDRWATLDGAGDTFDAVPAPER